MKKSILIKYKKVFKKGDNLMVFKDFAQRNASVMKKNSTTSAFVRTLFEAMLPNRKKGLLDGISDNTFKSYYNGHASIDSIAKKIYADINTKLFIEFIAQHGKNAIQKLCDAFSDYLPDINPENAGEKIAELFYQIIREATEKDINISASNEQTYNHQSINQGIIYNQQNSNQINNYNIDYVNTINC